MKIDAPLSRNHSFSRQGWVPGRPKIKKNLNPQSSIPESLNPQSSTRFYTKKCPKGAPRSTPEYPRRSQRGPKIHQKSLKIGPCSQMAPQGHPGMPLGTPGPPKWSPGTSKVTIWDLKSDHFTLISNHCLYQNSKKCRSFPLFFIVFASSFRRQSTSQMLDDG